LTNTREARRETWTPGHFEVQDNPTISEGFLSPAEARSRKSAGSLPAVCRESGSPGLRFKQVHPTEPIYSVRISRNYRALGVREDDAMIWFWIGSHADYDDLISRM
jgi:hypothetical protein